MGPSRKLGPANVTLSFPSFSVLPLWSSVMPEDATTVRWLSGSKNVMPGAANKEVALLSLFTLLSSSKGPELPVCSPFYLQHETIVTHLRHCIWVFCYFQLNALLTVPSVSSSVTWDCYCYTLDGVCVKMKYRCKWEASWKWLAQSKHLASITSVIIQTWWYFYPYV